MEKSILYITKGIRLARTFCNLNHPFEYCPSTIEWFKTVCYIRPFAPPSSIPHCQVSEYFRNLWRTQRRFVFTENKSENWTAPRRKLGPVRSEEPPFPGYFFNNLSARSNCYVCAPIATAKINTAPVFKALSPETFHRIDIARFLPRIG